jgi:hypothetical protein
LVLLCSQELGKTGKDVSYSLDSFSDGVQTPIWIMVSPTLGLEVIE